MSKAQVRESFDGGATAWQLGRDDCNTELLSQHRSASGGRDGGPCEMLTFRAAAGTRVEMVYPVSPIEVIDELAVSLWFWGPRSGASMSVRVRFPFALDEKTGKPLQAWLGTARYDDPGRWQPLRLTGLRADLALQEIVLRRAHHPNLDLRKPYIDAVVVNVYTGPGVSAIRFDDMRIDNALRAQLSPVPPRASVSNPSSPHPLGIAFPVGRIKRLLEYNGEALQWIRANGFDGIVLDSVPEAALLREANERGIEIIAPASTVSRIDLAGMLSPITAWNLGDALLEKDTSEKIELAGQLRRLPSPSRREIVSFPIESHRHYGSISDYVAIDVPPPVRGLAPHEEAALMAEQLLTTGPSRRVLATLATSSPERLHEQLDQLADSIQSSHVDDYGWHAIWLQAMRALEACPRGVVFRSERRLDSGRREDQQRSTILRMINSVFAMCEPYVSGGAAENALACSDADYRACLIRKGNAGLILATSTRSVGTFPQAGNGQVLTIRLPPSLRGVRAARFTELQVRTLHVDVTTNDTSIDIVAPDFVELIVVSSNPGDFQRLASSLRQQIRQLVFDRWQLVNESLVRTTDGWHEIMAQGFANPASSPLERVKLASDTLGQAWSMYQANDFVSAYRLIRRADAWNTEAVADMLKVLARYTGDLSGHPAQHVPQSVPLFLRKVSVSQGGIWQGIATVDPFANGSLWTSAGWSHDVRREDLATTNVFVETNEASGRTQITMRAKGQDGQPLPGGYAGTVVRIRSNEFPVEAGDWLRIEASIKLAAERRRPHRGVLIYDSVSGPELGLLVRPTDDWKQVELFRLVSEKAPMNIIFELIGDGEASIGKLVVSKWVPNQRPSIPFRPLVSAAPQRSKTESR